MENNIKVSKEKIKRDDLLIITKYDENSKRKYEEIFFNLLRRRNEFEVNCLKKQGCKAILMNLREKYCFDNDGGEFLTICEEIREYTLKMNKNKKLNIYKAIFRRVPRIEK